MMVALRAFTVWMLAWLVIAAVVAIGGMFIYGPDSPVGPVAGTFFLITGIIQPIACVVLWALSCLRVDSIKTVCRDIRDYVVDR